MDIHALQEQWQHSKDPHAKVIQALQVGAGILRSTMSRRMRADVSG